MVRSIRGARGTAFLAVALLFTAVSDAADEIPRMVVIEAGRVITATGDEFMPGTVVIEDGKVILVGTRLEYPKSAEVIDARRETVMPGLTLTQTRFQLPNYRRSGSRAAQLASSEVFPSEIDWDALISRGFLYAAFAPVGRGIPGQASLYRTVGKDGPELIDDSAYVRVGFTNPSAEKRELSRTLGNAKKAIEARDKARADWEKAQAEAKKKAEEAAKKKAAESKEGDGKSKSGDKEKGGKKDDAKPAEFKPPRMDPNLAPFVDLLDGKEEPLLTFELRNASGLVHLEDVLEDYDKIDGALFLSSGIYNDFPEVLDRLGDREALTVLAPTIARRPHTVNLFNLAKDLVEAGCELAFRPSSDNTGGYDRYLGQVGNLVREGLERDTAISAVTLGPAKVVGIDGETGTIETDKRADLIFLSGDPLRTGTKVTRAMVAGEIVWEDE
ncbi:MAG: amidohydrolase family protein [Planctomycetota bacterium]